MDHPNEPEPIHNIGWVCREHAPKPGKYSGQDPNNFMHKFVKLGFPSPQGVEHMWVYVERLGTQGTDLEGVLSNDPVYDVGYACEDGVGFDVSEIEAVQGE